MALNLRLTTLKLRQKLNFRLVKLLLLVIYLAATFGFVVHNFSGSQGNEAVEFLVEVDTSETFTGCPQKKDLLALEGHSTCKNGRISKSKSPEKLRL